MVNSNKTDNNIKKKNTQRNKLQNKNTKKTSALENFMVSLKGLKLSPKARLLRKIGLGLACLEIIAAISFIVFTLVLNMIPMKYEIIIILVLFIISAYVFLSQLTKAHWIGKVLSVILSIVMIVGDVYIGQAIGAVGTISGTKTKTDVVSVYVLKDDPANNINEAADYTFGRHSVLDKANTDETINKINKSIGRDIELTSFDDMNKMVDSLYNNSVGAIIINESYVSTLQDTYPDFKSDTKIINTESFVTEIQAKTEKDVTKDTFTVYISGNDEYGYLTQTGRSDVNILLVINPATRQILMINTPRDYYIDVYSLTSGVGKDKLTHAGNFGVDASMESLSALYNFEVDYYVKMNFTGFEGIIDALGGVTVYSEQSFTTLHGGDYISQGNNYLSGAQALGFVRERYALNGGDNQRGKNQMALIKGVISKAASPAILTSYSSVLNAVSDLFATSLSNTDISSLVKMMIDDPTGWNVQSYAATGSGSSGSSYFFGLSGMYIMIPDTNSVNMANELINKIKNNEVFDVDSYVQSAK